MDETFEVHAVSVGGYPIFKCCDCGHTARGDWFRADYGGSMPTPHEIARSVTAHYMPVGWASYSGPTYRCPEHKR